MTPSRPFVLTAYPLSHEFRERLELAEGGELEYLSIPQLRRLGVRGLLSTLRPMRGRLCLIALEDIGSESILPLLEGVAAVALPSSIEVVHADLRRERVSRAQIGRTALRVARAGMDGQLARRAASRRLEELSIAPRLEAGLGPGGRVVSINASLWFGVKAGGSLAHTGGVANGLVGGGYDVDLVAPFDVAHLRPGVTEHRTEPPKTFAPPSEVNYFRYEDALYVRVSELAAARPPAFVYQRLSTHSHVGARLSRALSVPLVVEYNGSEVWVARHWGRSLRYERLALRAEEVLLSHAHVVVTVSDVLRNELLERGVDKQRIVVYPNCVDAELFDPGRFDAATAGWCAPATGSTTTPWLRRSWALSGAGTAPRCSRTQSVGSSIRRRSGSPAGACTFCFVGDGLRMPEVEQTLGGRKGPFHTLVGLVPQADAAGLSRSIGSRPLAARPERGRLPVLRLADEALRVHGDGPADHRV